MGVRVERIMGTVVSIDVRDPDLQVPAVTAAIEAAVAWLRDVDGRFSVYREDSEIRRLDRGELALDDCHPDVRHVLRSCDDLRIATEGAFDARRHRPDGGLDPSGFVKGWAVDEAADLLVAAGARSFSINAGGDVVVRGEPSPGKAWRVGVRHPQDPARVAAVLEVRGGAGGARQRDRPGPAPRACRCVRHGRVRDGLVGAGLGRRASGIRRPRDRPGRHRHVVGRRRCGPGVTLPPHMFRLASEWVGTTTFEGRTPPPARRPG
jgi:hypothetical protein